MEVMKALIELLKPIGLVAINYLIGALAAGKHGGVAGACTGTAVAVSLWGSSWNKNLSVLISFFRQLDLTTILAAAEKFISSVQMHLIPIAFGIARMSQIA